MGSLRLDRVVLRFGSLTVAVATSDARIQDQLRSYFRGFAVAKTTARADMVIEASLEHAQSPRMKLVPWDARGKESFVDTDRGRLIRKDRTGVVITVEGRRWSIRGDLHRNFSQLLNLVGTAYGLSLMDLGGAMLHASAVVRSGRALAVIGQSGSGKSSVAVRLLERGFDFLANDRVIVESNASGVFAHGLPKLPRVNPGTLLAGKQTRSLIDERSRRRYARLSPSELWHLEEKYDLDVERALGRAWTLSAPFACAFVLNWRLGGGDLVIQQLEPGQAFDAIQTATKSFGPFDLKLSRRSDRALRSLARSVPVYRVTGAQDPSALAAEIARRRWARVPSHSNGRVRKITVTPQERVVSKCRSPRVR